MSARLTGIAIGLLLMGAPGMLGYDGPMADVQHVVGPLVVAATTIAIASATTPVRWLDVPLGLIVMGGAVLGEPFVSGQWLSVLGGGALTALAFVPSPPHGPVGGGWRALFAPDPAERRTAETRPDRS